MGRVWIVGALVAALCGLALATDLPVTYQDCRTRAWPKVIFEGDTLGPGTAPDTIDVLVGEELTFTVLMAVDDSSNGHGQYRCNCRKIEAKCALDSTRVPPVPVHYSYWIKVFQDQPEPPDWTRQENSDTVRNIGRTLSDTCAGPITACPASFVMPSLSFSREGRGAVVVRGRIYNYNMDYLAPAADTTRINVRVWCSASVGTGARVMVPK
jgi:hypothetical protein